MKFSFLAGRSWGVCDRCGTKMDVAAMRSEWTSLRVCGTCFDPRPADLNPPYLDPQEGSAVANPRPRPSDVFLADGDVTEADL